MVHLKASRIYKKWSKEEIGLFFAFIETQKSMLLSNFRLNLKNDQTVYKDYKFFKSMADFIKSKS